MTATDRSSPPSLSPSDPWAMDGNCQGVITAVVTAGSRAMTALPALGGTPHLTPDRGAFVRQLDHLFKEATGDGLVELAWTPPRQGSVVFARQFALDELETMADVMVARASEGRNLYVAAGLRHANMPRGLRSNAGFVTSLVALWADFDDAGAAGTALRQTQALAIPPTMVVQTASVPHDRVQFWWRLEEPCTDLAAGSAALAALASILGGDIQVKNVDRVMRAAGSVAWAVKPGRVAEPVKILDGWSDRSAPYAFAEITRTLNGAAPPGETGNLAGVVDLNAARAHETPAERIAKTFAPGQWHNGTRDWVATAVRQGLSDDMIASLAPAFRRDGFSVEQTERELLKFAEGARRKGWTPPVLPELGYQESPASGPEREEIPLHLLNPPGLVGDIADWIIRTSRHPLPALAIAAALVLVGTAAGQKYAGPTDSGTHLYVIALAPTGAGKNHAPKMAGRLLKAANLKELSGPSQFYSDSAVWKVMEARPTLVCFMDEFGSWMTKLNNPKSSGHEKRITGLLRTFWGMSFGEVNGGAWAQSPATPPIQSPALSIYGTSVPEEMYAALSSADVVNGFLNRFLTIAAPAAQEVDPELDEFEAPTALAEAIARIHAAELPVVAQATLTCADGPAIRVPWATDDVRDAYREFRRELERRGSEQALLTRTAEMAVRIATILAVGREGVSAQVELSDWEWGRDLALWSAERMIADAAAHMVENEHQRQTKLVLRIIKEAPARTISKADLTKKIDGRIKGNDLKSILASLEDAELITRGKRASKGREAEVWRAV